MSAGEFAQRIQRDAVQLEISAGAFAENMPVAFYMNGLGLWQGKQTVYDAGTGVIPEYRGRGIAKELLGAYLDDKCVGYGVVFQPTGNLMQLAVAHAHRRKGIGSKILQALSAGESLKVNNVDEILKGTLAFYEANGFKLVLEQYEMSKNL